MTINLNDITKRRKTKVISISIEDNSYHAMKNRGIKPTKLFRRALKEVGIDE